MSTRHGLGETESIMGFWQDEERKCTEKSYSFPLQPLRELGIFGVATAVQCYKCFSLLSMLLLVFIASIAGKS